MEVSEASGFFPDSIGKLSAKRTKNNLFKGTLNARKPTFFLGRQRRRAKGANASKASRHDVGKDLISDESRLFRIKAIFSECATTSRLKGLACLRNERNINELSELTDSLTPSIRKQAKPKILGFERLKPRLNVRLRFLIRISL